MHKHPIYFFMYTNGRGPYSQPTTLRIRLANPSQTHLGPNNLFDLNHLSWAASDRQSVAYKLCLEAQAVPYFYAPTNGARVMTFKNCFKNAPKKSPRTSSMVQIIFSFRSFEISGGILRNQKFIIGLYSFSNQYLIYLDLF